MQQARDERRIDVFVWSLSDGIYKCIERAKQGVDSPVLRECVFQYMLDCTSANHKPLALVLVAKLEQELFPPITGETNGDVPTQ